MLDNTDTETTSAFRFEFIDFLIVSASHDASGHAISRQKFLSCIWNRGNWEEGDRGTAKQTNNRGTGEHGNIGTSEHRNRGTREQENGGTGKQGDRGTGEQGNRVCLWCGRTDGRKVTWLLVTTNISRMQCLPSFLTRGAPLRARAPLYYTMVVTKRLPENPVETWRFWSF